MEHAEAPFARFRGHEFHYSRWLGEDEFANLWTVRGNRLGTQRTEGFRMGALHASYVHLYFAASRQALEPLVPYLMERML
jgi:cobyrinic acid a,c-diamide synthase